MMGNATGACRDKRRTVTGAAGDAVEARGLDGPGEGRRRPEGGGPLGQHRLARPRGPSRRTLWAERLHRLDLRIRACRRPVRLSQKLPAW
jgi:hypothetical protein